MAFTWKRTTMGMLAALLSVSVAGCTGTQSKVTKLVIGYVPSSDAGKISDKVKPLSDFLSKELGLQIETYVGTSYMATVEGMGSKKIDVGFLNPMSYVLAHGDYNTEVLLKTTRKGADTYRAQLSVRKDSGIPVCDQAKDAKCTATFAALKGKKLAFVEPASTSGYLFPASYMMSNGIKLEKGAWFSDVIMAGSHDNAVKQVYNKQVDAAWSFEDARDTIAKDFPDVKDVLVQAAFTAPIPNDTISVRADLPADLKAKIKAAFLKFVGTDEGKKVLNDLYQIDGFKEAKDSDYQVVKDMAKNMGVDIKGEISKPSK